VRAGLEGVVAKPLASTYRPGERGGWVKVKNRDYWRFGQERDGVQRRRGPSYFPN
jgi:ATP-dependent DNA ligase